MDKFNKHPKYNRYYEIIKANSPVAYGGTKMFDGDRDYLMQIPEEFASTLCFFHEVFNENKINLLEIGTASNLANTIFWNNFCIENNIIIDALVCCNIEKSLVGNLKYKPGTVFIVGDSTSSNVQNKVSKLKLEYDLIFSDGNHEYEYVKRDFEFYSQFVKPGGYFLFHDTNNHKAQGVRKFLFSVDMKREGFEKVLDLEHTGYENTCGIRIYQKRNV